MNTVLLESSDFVCENRVRLWGRRRDHICKILNPLTGAEVRVGVVGGQMGCGRIEVVTEDAVEMTISLNSDPPPPLPLQLILALPRPKVLNRTIAAAASMGIREIHLINSWRVESPTGTAPGFRRRIFGCNPCWGWNRRAIRFFRRFISIACLRPLSAMNCHDS